MTNKTRPIPIYILLAFILFQGISGIAGGTGLILDPSGKSLQIPISWLDGSPFSNYLIPGLILFVVLGLYPLIVFYSLLKKLRWSWFAAFVLGAALLIWIGVEIIIIGYQPQPPLQLIYGLVGFIILVLVFLPSVRSFLKSGK
ncbi:MAG: hypothetical protein GF421_08590 [Candidatus Aminicenantes bacterium]|nr:hypothetical protein [Candidatus Aminicenantes bacterium]